jgi:serine/threonine-protein kinase
VLDLRMGCLEDRLKDARALSELLGTADAQMVDKAAQAAQSLPPLAGCADVRALREKVPLPPDPELRARVEVVKRDLARVRALEQTSRFADGLRVSSKLVDDADKLGYAPLVAQALQQRAHIDQWLANYDDARTEYKRSSVAALSGRDLATAAKGYLALAFLAAYHDERPAEAEEWLELASALIQSLGGDDELESERLHLLAMLAGMRESYELMEDYARRALRLREKTFGSGSVMVAVDLGSLGLALKHRGKLDEAQAAFRRATELREATLGPRHPTVAVDLSNLASVYNEMGRFADALAADRRVLDIDEATLGSDHPDVADSRYRVADDLVSLGRFAEAVPLAEAALASGEKRSDAQNRPALLQLLGRAKIAMGHPREAVPLLERALAIADADSETVAIAGRALAPLLWEQDRVRALEVARAARAALVKHKGEKDPDVRKWDEWIATHSP